jgi:hypothetical protein
MSRFCRRINKFVFFISILLFVFSFFWKGRLPDKKEILPLLYRDPVQTPTSDSPFNVARAGKTYHIVPVADYEQYGMVASYHNSSAWWDIYHKSWGDLINVKDICVIWGNNIVTEIYKKLTFRSASFHVEVRTKPGVPYGEWGKYRNDCLSNNHLLADNPKINNLIMATEKGDQVYLRGWLVNYSINNMGYRRSSISRSDTGMGACEVIFVKEYKILKKANTEWRTIHQYSKYGILISIIFMLLCVIALPYQG